MNKILGFYCSRRDFIVYTGERLRDNRMFIKKLNNRNVDANQIILYWFIINPKLIQVITPTHQIAFDGQRRRLY